MINGENPPMHQAHSFFNAYKNIENNYMEKIAYQCFEPVSVINKDFPGWTNHIHHFKTFLNSKQKLSNKLHVVVYVHPVCQLLQIAFVLQFSERSQEGLCCTMKIKNIRVRSLRQKFSRPQGSLLYNEVLPFLNRPTLKLCLM